MKEDLNYRELVVKFLAGEILDSEADMLKEWLEKHPDNRRIFDIENELWQKSGTKTVLEHYRTDEAWSEISEKIGLKKRKVADIIILTRTRFRIFVAAASVTFFIALGGILLWMTEKRSVKFLFDASTVISTNEGEKARIFLSDSTNVIINSGSLFEYKSDFNVKDRIVKLKGEAFFDVRTNPEKPLQVQLEKMTIFAAGTQFNVFSYENENRIEATLGEGKIKVDIPGQKSIELKAGQQVVYFTKKNKAEVRDVNAETYTSWKENKLRFVDTPFEEVLRGIARRYNVTFEVTNRELLELKYTATFIDESVEEVMQMLKRVSPITYKIYNRTTVMDKHYLKPKIVVGKRKCSV